MKKVTLLILVLLVFSFGMVSEAGVADRILLYIPNRLVDMVDVFSLELGFGPVIRGHLRVTRACDMGAGAGATAKAVKQINRQYGGCLENGWEANFLMIAAENKERKKTSRGVKNFYYYATGVPLPEERIYDFYDGARDYWAVGADVAALVEVNGDIHFIEIADFITGWLFIDLKADDFTGDDLRL